MSHFFLLQGDHPWEEGDSSSFPPEGFAGDLPAGQQPQGVSVDFCVTKRASLDQALGSQHLER